MKQPQDIDPLWLLLILGPMGSVAGLAALLRSGAALDRRSFVSALLNSFFLAVIAASACYWKFGTEAVWLTITLSLLAGLGGNTVVVLVLAIVERKLKKHLGSDGD